ncbi:hypothetical protein Ae201684P_015926 [Aphanomyces euteiches]|uniref:Endo-1,5-alpha-L-arabinanase A n=1 Tax=Aphanomyces euteiches TaxID=100861 RepID=A0A6G0W3X4_9STRA|nr:hypothetical protein Ae201684_018888 [Aphanomyces euteiches]KAH9074028.1 hypothetical protein Ae201684P_015926 [Aphanomyces euteiches]KAH9136308.1 hypothetical protein AeRB84_018474 [Aphanomyces euteiches]
MHKGAAIPACSRINLPGRDGLWAPDVTKVGDTYYLYYSVNAFGNKNSAIGVATSKTMDVGSWTNLGSTGITSSSSTPYKAIDQARQLLQPILLSRSVLWIRYESPSNGKRVQDQGVPLESHQERLC